MADIEIKKSNIHGQGAFAARNFKAGEIVLKWHPKVITKKELAELSDEDRHYILRQDREIYLMQAPERFVNFSCEPNTHSSHGFDIASRDIQMGEEITSDYADEKDLQEFKCNCGKCRENVRRNMLED